MSMNGKGWPEQNIVFKKIVVADKWSVKWLYDKLTLEIVNSQYPIQKESDGDVSLGDVYLWNIKKTRFMAWTAFTVCL